MVQDIQTGKTTFTRQTCASPVRKVKCQERDCAAVYDKERKTIVMVMALD